MASFEVRVVNENQGPIKGVAVRLEFKGLLLGITSEDYTDAEGVALFYGHKEGKVNIFVNDDSYGEYQFRDGDQVTIKAK